MRFARRCRNLEDEWHPSITDLKTGWCRLLSQFQPYAHAVKVHEDGEEWLTETRTYSFFDLNEGKVSRDEVRNSLSDFLRSQCD